MGGVLTEDPFVALDDYARELDLPQGALSDYLRGARGGFGEVERGLASMREFLKATCIEVENTHGVRVDIRRLADAMAAGQRVRPEMPGLLRDLHDSGVLIGLLTNNVKEARAWWSSGVIPLELFSDVVDSSEVGLRKPDPAVYRLAAERLGVEPHEVVFVDDLPENVAGAEAVGMTGVLFSDPDTCRSDLSGHGLG